MDMLPVFDPEVLANAPRPAEAQLLGGDDHDTVPHGSPLLGRGDHDRVPHGSPLLGGGDHDRVPHGRPLLGRGEHDRVHHGPSLLGEGDHDRVHHGHGLLGEGDHDRVHHGHHLGEGDHDRLHHGHHLLGRGAHDRMHHGSNLLGRGEHDRIPHVLHGPELFGGSNDEHSSLFLIRNHLHAASLFKAFMQLHNRTYDTLKEFGHRFTVFRQNLVKVAKLQRQEKGSATYGLSKFADRTAEEFQQILGFRPTHRRASPYREVAAPTNRSGPLPKS